MGHPLYQRDILSMKDLSLNDIKQILLTSQQLKQQPADDLLKNKLVAHCFFEPSTRTRLSFESATLRLGGKVLGFSNEEGLSIRKGENLHDTMKVIEAYADLIVLRHPQEGAARFTSEIINKPVINAGDGANQHPTQALIDLFTIHECQGRLDNLSIGLVGDLKYSRTVHSLVEACMLLGIRLYLVSPENLVLPETLCDLLKKNGVRFSFHRSIAEVIKKVDVLYMTRFQKERFDPTVFQLNPNQYTLTPELLVQAKSNLKILHPLPRLQEIDAIIDQSPFAYYFNQAANGVYVRQALLTLILNEQLP